MSIRSWLKSMDKISVLEISCPMQALAASHWPRLILLQKNMKSCLIAVRCSSPKLCSMDMTSIFGERSFVCFPFLFLRIFSFKWSKDQSKAISTSSIRIFPNELNKSKWNIFLAKILFETHTHTHAQKQNSNLRVWRNKKKSHFCLSSDWLDNCYIFICEFKVWLFLWYFFSEWS